MYLKRKEICLMKLHVFNPEHDIALAVNMEQFTAPHAPRELRADLGYLPALWAEDGDMVLVDDVPAALEAVRHHGDDAQEVIFVTDRDLQQLSTLSPMKVEAWGMNKSLVMRLLACNPNFTAVLPNDAQLDTIRQMSNRRFAATHILPALVASHPRFVGKSTYFTGQVQSLKTLFNQPHQRFVLKAPWSSSGRGMRYVDHDFTPHVEGWCKNLIHRQGGIMIEPQYDKVLDFGMEFEASAQGDIQYLGLSLFSTEHGAYLGNIVASEETKRQEISQFISLDLLNFLQRTLHSLLVAEVSGKYVGSFGVDMMIVKLADATELCVHPCVEINFRRTMGHVALSLSTNDVPQPKRLMQITYTDKYRLKVSLTGDDLATPYTF